MDTLRPITLRLRAGLGTDAGGYVTAIAEGYYESAGLDVTLAPTDPGAPMPADAVGAEFVVSWVPAVLFARERDGSDLVAIAQIAQRSATLSLAWKSTSITGPEDLAGRTMGILAPGAAAEIVAATVAAGLAPGDPASVVVGSSVSTFLSRDIDAIQALLYDGYATVLEAEDPATGRPWQTTDLDVINYADHGTAMLQDAIFASAGWLATGDNEDIATAFLEASFRGWVTCRDDPDACVSATVAALEASRPAASAAPSANGSAAASPSPSAAPGPGRGHLAWMLNEYLPLVWPSPDGIGLVREDAWADTVEVLLDAGLLAAAPSADAVRMDLAAAALAELEGVDTAGMAYEKGLVDITPGGEQPPRRGGARSRPRRKPGVCTRRR